MATVGVVGILFAAPAAGYRSHRSADAARRVYFQRSLLERPLHPNIVVPRFTPPYRAEPPFFRAEPLPEPQYGPSAPSFAPLPLPGNIIVEVPTRGPVPARLDKIRDVGPYLTACWRAPGRGGAVGLRQLTLRMGFKRSGALMGPPRMTYSTPPLTTRGQRAFVAASTSAFQRCTPLPLSVGFGNAIAGVPFAIRFTDLAR